MCLFLLCLSYVLVAADVKKVAILETVDKAGDISYGIKLQVRSNLTYAITNATGYEGYDRVDVASIMDEHNFQRTGLVSDAQIKKLGEMTGAQYVLIAEAALYDENSIIITAKIIDVETGNVINSAPAAIASRDPEKMQDACISLAKKLMSIDTSFSYSSSTPSAPSKMSSSPNMSVRDVERKNYQDFTENMYGLNMKMVWVEGGSFSMGCTNEQSDCDSDEKRVRRISLDGYWMSTCEVTQSQWEKVMGSSVYQLRDNVNSSWPLYGVGDNYPIYYVSWQEAVEFCSQLSRATGRTYVLPTEAQWEYAARGGNQGDATKYAGSNQIDVVCWYSENGGGETHPVGLKRPNALGLYDMSGNVWEWCSDWYSDGYSTSDLYNPVGAASGSMRVYRGGGIGYKQKYCRVTSRGALSPTRRNGSGGFRVICIP